MKCLATVTALAWAAAAAPSLNARSPALGDSMKPGMTVVSDGQGHTKRAPAPRMGDSLDPGVTVISHGAAPASGAGKEQKRATVENDCSSGGKQQFVDQSLADCVARARAGQKAAQDTNSQMMMTFFKTDSPDVRKTVAGNFVKMAKECQARFASSNTTVTCAPSRNQCGPGTVAVTTSFGPPDQVDSGRPKPKISLCDMFFKLNPESAGTGNAGTGNRGDGNPGDDDANSGVFGRQAGSQPACGSLDSPGVMLHEMSHAVIGTTDMKKTNGQGSYGLQDVQNLSADQNLEHADTYALFAHAAALNCSTDDLRSGRAPEAGVPAGLYGNKVNSTETQPGSAAPEQGTGVSGGQRPQRTTTAPPQKTRVRVPTQGTKGPGPRIPQQQPPQAPRPETRPPAEGPAEDPVEEGTGFQPETQQTKQNERWNLPPSPSWNRA
ncbi:lysine-specific metallo-endopeptidase domain-containing protein [Hirsutella rhossiliensis]|uniref:deuterolysin n=1 Tax=Hirsutella rhossiliensis TaxID=111463 RepID=A0A9P8MV07_9HYPO|nr:lysine-specific metallo-endopeptidase domain-containing protein [Hirsutella rhossiliensis]KAH0959697.1 lysine-specific metallo-endopeptidase domain-containing protein [Hirsutella rhossiliensis]